MENEFLNAYEKLNDKGKMFVNIAIKSVMKSPENLIDTPKKELLKIKCQRKRAEKIRNIEEEKYRQHFKELKAECDAMSHEDYVVRLNALLSGLPTSKLRYFYIFIKEKLDCDGRRCLP